MSTSILSPTYLTSSRPSGLPSSNSSSSSNSPPGSNSSVSSQYKSAASSSVPVYGSNVNRLKSVFFTGNPAYANRPSNQTEEAPTSYLAPPPVPPKHVSRGIRQPVDASNDQDASNGDKNRSRSLSTPRSVDPSSQSNTMSKPTGTNSIVASRINNLFNAGQTESQDPQRSPPNNKQSSDHLTRFQSAKALFAKMEEEILSKTSTSPTNLTQRPSNVSNYFAKQANSTARRSLNSYGLNSFSSTSNGVSTTSPAAITSRRPLGTSHTTSDDTGHHQYKLSKNTSESALNSSSRIPITSNSASNKTTTSPPISLSSRSSSESLLAPNTGHQNVNTNGYCTSTATVTLSPVSSSSANKSWSKLNAVASSNTNNIKYEPQPSPSTPVISENSNRLLIVSNSNEDNESSTEPSLSSSSENPSNGDIKSHATNYYQKSNDYHCPQVIKSDLAGYLHNYNSDRLPNSDSIQNGYTMNEMKRNVHEATSTTLPSVAQNETYFVEESTSTSSIDSTNVYPSHHQVEQQVTPTSKIIESEQIERVDTDEARMVDEENFDEENKMISTYDEETDFYYEIPGLAELEADDEDGNKRAEEDPAMEIRSYSISASTTTSTGSCIRRTRRQAKRSVKFSTNPIKVYATFSTSDYNRRNEEIDPIGASAEYELEKRIEKMDVFVVDIERGPDGLGFSILGMGVGAEQGIQKLGIFIKAITPGGSAARTNMLRVGDQIIEVDGVSLVGVTQNFAATVLRSIKDQAKLTIGRERLRPGELSEIAKLILQSLEQDKPRDKAPEATPTPPPVTSNSQSIPTAAAPNPQTTQSTVSAPSVVDKQPEIEQGEPEFIDEDDECKEQFEEEVVVEEKCKIDLNELMENARKEVEDRKNQEIQAVQTELTECQQHVKKLQSDLALSNRRCEDLIGNETQLNGEIVSLKNKLQQAMDQNAELENKLSENATRLKLFEQRDEEQAKEIARLKETIQKLIVSNSNEESYKKPQQHNEEETVHQETFETNLPHPISLNQHVYQQPSYNYYQHHGNHYVAPSYASSTASIPSSLHSSMSKMMNPNLLNELKRNFSNNPHNMMYQSPAEIVDATPSTASNNSVAASSSSIHMLNNDLSKFKSSLIKKGSLANRHQPQQQPQTTVQSKQLMYGGNGSQDDETDTGTTVTTTTNDVYDRDYNDFMDENNSNKDEYDLYKGAGYNKNIMNSQSLSSQPHLDLIHRKEYVVESNSKQPGYLIHKTTKTSTISGSIPASGSTIILHAAHGHPSQSEMFNFSQPVDQWSCESVAQWLAVNGLSDFVGSFLDKDVDGEELINLDSSKMKMLGIKSQKDRDFLKNKIKELKMEDKRYRLLFMEQAQQQPYVKTPSMSQLKRYN